MLYGNNHSRIALLPSRPSQSLLVPHLYVITQPVNMAQIQEREDDDLFQTLNQAPPFCSSSSLSWTLWLWRSGCTSCSRTSWLASPSGSWLGSPRTSGPTLTPAWTQASSSRTTSHCPTVSGSPSGLSCSKGECERDKMYSRLIHFSTTLFRRYT